VEFQAYLGVCTECPENTVESIQAASEQGYNSVGIEINITSDGQFVLLCDDTVNRTARMPGGALIPREVSVRDITYEQALEYDFGIGFSRKFKGTAIPFLLDVLEFAAKSGIVISIGSSHERLSGDEREALFSILGDYGSRVRIVCRSLSLLEFAAKTLPKIGLCYEGEVDGEMLERIGRNIPKSRLSVRLDVNSAARELCERKNIPVCDCYSKWKELSKTEDTTMLLANRINHPTKEMHELFAQSLFEMLFPENENIDTDSESTMYKG